MFNFDTIHLALISLSIREMIDRTRLFKLISSSILSTNIDKYLIF